MSCHPKRDFLFRVTSSQFPKGSMMNPFRRQEYEDYRKAQERLGKKPEWHEFLKLNKKQCHNFRVTN